MAVGTTTVTRASCPLGIADTRPYQEIITIDWTAGTVSEAGAVPSATISMVYGTLQRLVTDPGSPAPDANYDITLTDEDGFDVLGGAGANRSATVTQEAVIAMGTYFQRVVANTLIFALADNTASGAKGVARLYILR